MDQQQLRARIRERMRSGLIPVRPDGSTFGGRGTNSTCACCSRTIEPRDVEYEVYFEGYPSAFRAHLDCYRIWWKEREWVASSVAAAAGQRAWESERGQPGHNIG